MREPSPQCGREAAGIVRERPGFRARAGDDAGAVERERTVRVGKQRDGGVDGHAPGDGVGGEPVRLRLGEVAADASHHDAQVLARGIPLEGDLHVAGRHREGDVGAVLHAALAVVHVPAAIERHLGLVRARGNGAGAEAVDRRAVDVLQPAAEAARIPVAAAADLALEAAGHGGDDRAHVLGDPVGLVVIVERHVARRRDGERDVRPVLLRVQAVVPVPRAVERHLVLERPGHADVEGVAPDVAVRVVREPRHGTGRIPLARAPGGRLIVAGDADRSGHGLRRDDGCVQPQYGECIQQRGADARALRGHVLLPTLN
jgi:hypothetical protein